VAASRNPTSIRPDRETGCRRERNIVSFGLGKDFPHLQSGTHDGSRALIVSAGLLVGGEEFEALQVMRPNAKRASPCVPSTGVVPGVSVQQLSVTLGAKLGIFMEIRT
jgi:hypothetical protein